MPILIAFLAKRGLSSRAAGIVGWIITVVLALLILFVLGRLAVDAIGDGREAKLKAERSAATIENTGIADKADASAEARDDANAARLDERIDDAKAANPESVGQSVGAASSAVHDELRRQRAAGQR